MSSLLATISLVTGGPEVNVFQMSSYLAFWYRPVFGRYFSNSFSSRIRGPAVAQLIVVSCVPIATLIVSSAEAGTFQSATPSMSAAAT